MDDGRRSRVKCAYLRAEQFLAARRSDPGDRDSSQSRALYPILSPRRKRAANRRSNPIENCKYARAGGPECEHRDFLVQLDIAKSDPLSCEVMNEMSQAPSRVWPKQCGPCPPHLLDSGSAQLISKLGNRCDDLSDQFRSLVCARLAHLFHLQSSTLLNDRLPQ